MLKIKTQSSPLPAVHGGSIKLDRLLIIVQSASCPEDVFGVLNGEPIAAIFRRLAKIAHPDAVKAKDKTKAEEAMRRLNDWHDKAEAKIAAGNYGDRTSDEVVINTKSDAYKLKRRIAAGDISDVWISTNKAGAEALVKVVRSPANNDLMANEAKMLRHLQQDSPAKDLKVMRHIPVLLDSFELRDGKLKKRVNVLQYIPGGFTLAQVKEVYPKGLELADAAWMFNRLLAALLAAHQSNVVHGAVIPEHILIFPEDHNGLLLDWSYSVNIGGIVKAISQSRRSFYAPEILEKKPASAGTDIFMASNCLTWLCPSLPTPFGALVRACTLHQSRRMGDVGEVAERFAELLKAIYGPPKFRQFVMPDMASK